MQSAEERANLTVNLALRWDVMPPFRDVENRFSFLNPTMNNPITSTPGALQFAGSGMDGCDCATPINTYYKEWGRGWERSMRWATRP